MSLSPEIITKPELSRTSQSLTNTNEYSGTGKDKRRANLLMTTSLANDVTPFGLFENFTA
jgi:hypothetical protein